MLLSSRFRRSALFLFLLLIVAFVSFRLPVLAAHATHPTHTPSPRSLISSCGAWSTIASPSPGPWNYLYGVAAISANNAWEVGTIQIGGTKQTLIEHWNGSKWHVVASPNPAGYINALQGVTAISTKNVWAVGYSFGSTSSLAQTLIEHWDGTSWSVVPSPNAGGYNILSAVRRVPGTNIVWAVGNYFSSLNNPIEQTLIEQWNGTNWNVISSPNVGPYDNGLAGVTALSENNVWAVGYFDVLNNQTSSNRTLIEHWDGINWSVVSSPSPGSLSSVLNSITQISGTSRLLAVGSFQNSEVSQTLIEQWNGTSWSVVTSPSPGAAVNTLVGIASISKNNVWAVGYDNNGSSYQTLIEQWNGVSWNVVSSPNPGSSNNLLQGIARVPGTSQLWAAGNANSSNAQTLTEFYC